MSKRFEFEFMTCSVEYGIFTNQIPVRGKQTQLVRIRNPWGNEREWTGAWSDKSKEWKMLSSDEKKELGITFGDDGEFW